MANLAFFAGGALVLQHGTIRTKTVTKGSELHSDCQRRGKKIRDVWWERSGPNPDTALVTKFGIVIASHVHFEHLNLCSNVYFDTSMAARPIKMTARAFHNQHF